MKRKEVFQSKYLSQQDVTTPIRATVATVTKELVGQGQDQEEKAVMHFTSNLKPMVINNINWTVMECAYGDESDFWAGKQVDIYVDPNVMFGKQRVGGLRLRVPGQGAVLAPAQQFWTLDQAVANCASAGISREEMVAYLKSKGSPGYSGLRDTPLLVEFINAKRSADEEQSFDGQPTGTDQDIPF